MMRKRMTRKFAGKAVAAMLLVACATVGARADNAARCASLAHQWDAAKTDKATSPNLGRAKAWATSAARDCAKGTPARQDDGVNEYIKALKLVGVTPK
jgi:hypothetical protein